MPCACTVFSQPHRRRFIAHSSKRTRSRSGCRPAALPAPCITCNRKSAARSKCRSGTSQQGTATRFTANTLSSFRNELVRYTDKFDDPNLAGDIQVTVSLKKVSVGTEINIVQEGLPEIIPLEACYLGWQESLQNLARLVEPEINQ